jgi:hypothetical protein
MMDRINAAGQEHNRDTRKQSLQQLLADLRDLAPSINLFPQVESVAYQKTLGKVEFESGYYRIERLQLEPPAKK